MDGKVEDSMDVLREEEQGIDQLEFGSASDNNCDVEEELASCTLPMPIGLNLNLKLIKDALERLLDNKLSLCHNQPEPSRRDNNSISSSSEPEKLKPANFPMCHIAIGSWNRSSMQEGDLITKLYFRKKKLIWEIFDQSILLKNKIEISWDDISAIKVTTNHNQSLSILEVQLDKLPSFWQETPPKPMKHTIWIQAPDFTNDQASFVRVHSVTFSHGIIDEHYRLLLQCDARLSQLSREPFPRDHASIYFNTVPAPTLALTTTYNNLGMHNGFESGFSQGVESSMSTSTLSLNPISIDAMDTSYAINQVGDFSVWNGASNSPIMQSLNQQCFTSQPPGHHSSYMALNCHPNSSCLNQHEPTPLLLESNNSSLNHNQLALMNYQQVDSSTPLQYRTYNNIMQHMHRLLVQNSVYNNNMQHMETIHPCPMQPTSHVSNYNAVMANNTVGLSFASRGSNMANNNGASMVSLGSFDPEVLNSILYKNINGRNLNESD